MLKTRKFIESSRKDLVGRIDSVSNTVTIDLYIFIVYFFIACLYYIVLFTLCMFLINLYYKKYVGSRGLYLVYNKFVMLMTNWKNMTDLKADLTGCCHLVLFVYHNTRTVYAQ